MYQSLFESHNTSPRLFGISLFWSVEILLLSCLELIGWGFIMPLTIVIICMLYLADTCSYGIRCAHGSVCLLARKGEIRLFNSSPNSAVNWIYSIFYNENMNLGSLREIGVTLSRWIPSERIYLQQLQFDPNAAEYLSIFRIQIQVLVSPSHENFQSSIFHSLLPSSESWCCVLEVVTTLKRPIIWVR